MARRWKRITAGPIVREVLYSCPEPRDNARTRAAKSKATTAARKAMNEKSARVKLEMLAACNFGPRDLFVSVTYRDGDLPEKRKDAQACIQKFFDRLRSDRRNRGEELRYIYCTEGKHGEGRFHHHFFINATGDDFEAIRSLWTWGDQAEFEYVEDRGYEVLAGYMLKEPRRVGDRGWSSSRNLKRPVVEIRYERDNSFTLQTPPDCQQLEMQESVTPYGGYCFIKYQRPYQSNESNVETDFSRRQSNEMEVIYRGVL